MQQEPISTEKWGMIMLYTEMGKRIRERRMEKGYTQDQLAERAGVSLSFMGHIERGTRKLSVETLIALCSVLNCSADELLGLEAERHAQDGAARALWDYALQLVQETLD